MNRFEIENENDDVGVTLVENMFINHFMPRADGDYVKVYLYGLKCTQNDINNMPSNRKIANTLGLTESDVLKAFKYWHDKQIISFESEGRKNYIIKYKNIATMIFNPDKFKKNGSFAEVIKENAKRQELFNEIDEILGRGSSLAEQEMISDWIDDYGFTREAVKLIIDTCINKKGKKHKNYWNAIATDFNEKGITTYDEVCNELNKSDKLYIIYNNIMKSLGITGRTISIGEKKLADKWLDEYKLSEEQILKECEKTTSSNSPSFKYLDSIIYNTYINDNKNENIKNNNKRNYKNKSSNVTTLQSDIDYDNYNEIDFEKLMSED